MSLQQSNSATRRVRSPRSIAGGFTLMELLVVIAIIAVLISFLLPALSSARRESNKAKCLAALRDLGQAFNIYAAEFKQTFPVVHHAATDSAIEGGPGLLPAGHERHWPDLIAKYAGAKADLTDMTRPLPNGSNPTQIYQNVWRLKDAKSQIWGCPEWQSGGLWEKLADGTTDNTFQTGFGMSVYANPADYINGSGDVRHNSMAWISTRSGGVKGRYHKSTTWGKKSADKMLLADSNVYYILGPIKAWNKDQPPKWFGYTGSQLKPPLLKDFANWYPNGATDSGDFYIDGGRHLRPGTSQTAQMGNKGVNVLFADFHAATVSVPEAFAAAMRPK